MNEQVIRKISIGSDYKNESMHYSLGQEVWKGNKICDIIKEESSFEIWVTKDGSTKIWKEFNFNMAVALEYQI